MELQVQQNDIIDSAFVVNDERFIEANTLPMSLKEIQGKHIIPVFTKDNSPTISQADFIQTTIDVVEEAAKSKYSNLGVRCSHPIKGRTFEARNKKAFELAEHEKTIYYERVAFSFDLPEFTDTVNGQELTLSVVGVKAYNQDNLNQTNSLQKFKVGIGYKVKVCTNLCLWSDGTALEIKARSLDDLQSQIYALIMQSRFSAQIQALRRFENYELSEEQFATLLGRARMYNHLPTNLRKEVPQLLISDSQISQVTREYYKDTNFPKNPNGSINLWSLYNLFTSAVKSSYIDTFMDRNLNAFTFTDGVANALEGEGEYSWFLN